MEIKTSPKDIWDEYQKGVRYKSAIGLFDRVRQNENFFCGMQWEGVNAPDLPKPVLNIIKPVVCYYVAMLISDDIKANIEIDGAPYMPGENTRQSDEQTLKHISAALCAEVENVLEQANIRFKNRKFIRNCAVDGDACLYIWFDVDAGALGEIKADIVDNTDVFFGDRSTCDTEPQPYIILAYRRLTEEVKEQAGAVAPQITPDGAGAADGCDFGEDYTTVLLKLYRQNGNVYMTKVTRDAVITAPTNTGYTRYPVCYMTWEPVKNRCHGTSPVTAAIPNQILINKLFAMQAIAVQNGAFPKILYDRCKIENWDGRPGRDIAVNGDPTGAVFSAFKAPDISFDAPRLIDSAIKYTKDLMGASDAALGNVKPDNTSAIIATQKAAGLPLDIQRLDFYNFIEDCVRSFIDIMRAKYGTRPVCFTDSDGVKKTVRINFGALPLNGLRLKIDVGQSAYWSELTQLKTLDNLMQMGIIPDALTYLEALPDGYVKNKHAIISRLKTASL